MITRAVSIKVLCRIKTKGWNLEYWIHALQKTCIQWIWSDSTFIIGHGWYANMLVIIRHIHDLYVLKKIVGLLEIELLKIVNYCEIISLIYYDWMIWSVVWNRSLLGYLKQIDNIFMIWICRCWCILHVSFPLLKCIKFPGVVILSEVKVLVGDFSALLLIPLSPIDWYLDRALPLSQTQMLQDLTTWLSALLSELMESILN